MTGKRKCLTGFSFSKKTSTPCSLSPCCHAVHQNTCLAAEGIIEKQNLGWVSLDHVRWYFFDLLSWRLTLPYLQKKPLKYSFRGLEITKVKRYSINKSGNHLFLFHSQGNLIQDSQDKEPCSPDSQGDHNLLEGWMVCRDLFKRTRDKTTDNQADTLVNPKRNEKKHTGYRQGILPFSCDVGLGPDESGLCRRRSGSFRLVDV